MKSFLKTLKRQDGFTLVELMVVVAIIGLLSAVAVPNFKKYQAKAKMAEAKLQLSALYTAETSFFSDYNMYHNCLTYMGFDPGPEANNRYYAVGFTDGPAAIVAGAHNAAVNSGLNAAGCPQANAVTAGVVGGPSTNPSTWFPAGKGIGAAIANTTTYVVGSALGTQDVGTMTYTAAAGGVISQDFSTDALASRLVINQAKVMNVTQNGY